MQDRLSAHAVVHTELRIRLAQINLNDINILLQLYKKI